LSNCADGYRMYENKGNDWPGLCNTGTKQSPINIIEGFNTQKDDSFVEFDYSLPEGSATKKLTYDGERLFMDINLGEMTFNNAKGSKETYNATRIELSFPSEHYVTIDGQTPRYPLEIQITHQLAKTDNLAITNEVMKVGKSIISILFTLGDLEEGDILLNALGISKFNTDEFDRFYLPAAGTHLTRVRPIPASYDVGFNYMAFQGLLNLLNADRHMFFYYGSETTPPCREEVLWMVYASPRSLSRPQFDYLLLLLAKNKNPAKRMIDATNPSELFGNKRALILYDENTRGKILSNPLGLRHVKRKSFFQHHSEDNF